MSSDFVTMTRTLVKREWSDIEPKIAVGIASGSIATGLVSFLQPLALAYGLHIPESVWVGLPAFVSLFGGYLTPSVGATITQPANDRVFSETHSGPVVTTITGPTPIQPAAAPVAEAPAAPGKYDDFLNGLKSAAVHSDNQATTAYNA